MSRLKAERIGEPLGSDQLVQELASLRGWSRTRGGLEKTYQFPNFRSACSFAQLVAAAAEAVGHAATLRILAARAHVRITSPRAGGVTARDLALARALDGGVWTS